MKVIIPVLNQEYSISCPEGARDDLYRSVADLQEICEKIQHKNARASIDKILVTAAINLASQVSKHRLALEELNTQIEQLKSKVELLD